MEEKLISVIVPVYKTEAYLRQCVDSIRNQTYRNLEIILVDDGSPDGSGKLCEEMSLEDPRIRVIHKENGGLSSARNAGLDIMHGDFVSFVDSDDWILPSMYECMYKAMGKYHIKVVACGLQTDNGRCFDSEHLLNRSITSFSCEEALIEITKNEKITNSVCDKLWSREIFDEIRFPIGKYYEDTRIMHRLLDAAKYIVYIPEPMYIYRETVGSITRGDFQTRKFEFVEAAKERIVYYSQKHPEICNYAVADYVRASLLLIWQSRNSYESAEYRSELIREMKGYLPKEAVALLNKKNKIKLYSLRTNLYLFYLAMITNEWLIRRKEGRIYER